MDLFSTSPGELTPPHFRGREGFSAQRQRGAYYTPSSAADYLAQWALRKAGETVLEPSFGDGSFLRALNRVALSRHLSPLLIGVELDEAVVAHARQNPELNDLELWCNDFLGVAPFQVQAVIGNPPFVRLRHLPLRERECALEAARTVMGHDINPSGSVWLPFVLHATRFLERGGRLAYVLPYEFTYVRYARQLWKFLGASFGSIQVLRTHERLFPEILQDVVVLLADDFGGRTDEVQYRAFERVEDLLQERPTVDESLKVSALIRGERSFVSALLGRDLRELLQTRIYSQTTPARELVTFNIGYVAGDKEFFHPTPEVARAWELPEESLLPALSSTRDLRGGGVLTSSLPPARLGQLFWPQSLLSPGEERYIAQGERSGVSDRYKCRVRKPWYIVPGVRVPDVVLSVFSERPLLLINDAECLASNSLLCGALRDGATGAELVASWYTSLTLLQCELEVHALGGGVMVMVPREAGNVRLCRPSPVEKAHLCQLNTLLQSGQVAQAYRLGDEVILRERLGLNEKEIELIREGIEVLEHWRTSARSSRSASLENVPEKSARVESRHHPVNESGDL